MIKREKSKSRQQRSVPKVRSEVTISFGQQELQFLVQALRDLPVSGTPDKLVQALPLIQSVRLKFASALQAIAGNEAAVKKDDASHEDAPPEPTPIKS